MAEQIQKRIRRKKTIEIQEDLRTEREKDQSERISKLLEATRMVEKIDEELSDGS